jgi:hypothetical protein
MDVIDSACGSATMETIWTSIPVVHRRPSLVSR